MSERPATYDCGAGCTCDAVTDLAAERTELMEEMAAALENLLDDYGFGVGLAYSEGRMEFDEQVKCLGHECKARAVLAKYRGEGEVHEPR